MYYDGTPKYKFSTTNYLRLLMLERNYKDTHRYYVEDVQKTGHCLQKFYNAADIYEVEKLHCKKFSR